MSSSVSLFEFLFDTFKSSYYSLGRAEDMISAGLHLNDLNLFDSTSDLLITGIHQEREIEDAIAKVSRLIIYKKNITDERKYQFDILFLATHLVREITGYKK
jgi:hypothetical protein